MRYGLQNTLRFTVPAHTSGPDRYPRLLHGERGFFRALDLEHRRSVYRTPKQALAP